jgi:hypothetical protein
MKKIIALIFLLILASCTAQAPKLDERAVQPEQTTEATQTEEITETSVEEPPEPVPVDDGTAERLAQEQAERIIESIETVQKLPPRDRTTIVEQMWQAFSGIDSYQYRSPKGVYYVRGTKIKLWPYEPIIKRNVQAEDKIIKEAYIDEIFIDRQTQKATGYCTGRLVDAKAHCADNQLFDVPFSIPYSEVNTKLPEDWLKEYVNQMPVDEEPDKYTIKNILTTRVVFSDEVEMYFFTKAGLPIQIIKSRLERINYDDLVINRVRPEDIIHRTKAEIPPEEPFYRPQY